MTFTSNTDLLQQAKEKLAYHKTLYWIVGGAGSGKTTICQALAAQYGLPVYDMDAHVYGEYHGRFSPTRHPVNTAWATARNGLGWLLDMTWAEFNNFNQAAFPEYADLLAQDLADSNPGQIVVIDGGISTPALAAQLIPAKQILCLANPSQTSTEIWEGSEERLAFKAFTNQLPNPEAAWQKFLDFDAKITQTILQECQTLDIPTIIRKPADPTADIVEQTAALLKI